MPRIKTINDSELIELIKRYFDTKHHSNKSIKYQDIARFINQNGYPNYQAATLRRNEMAREYIQKMISSFNDDEFMKLVTYKTIDAELFLDNNRTRASLIRAITEQDNYYRTVADAAVQVHKRYEELSNILNEQKSKIEELEYIICRLETELETAKDIIKTKEKKIKIHKKVLETYVYPEVAESLLEKEGIRQKKEHIIDEKVFESKVISSNDTIVSSSDSSVKSKSESKVIEGLFNYIERS